MAIRVLLADDHTIVRDGLKLVLEAAEAVEVVGEASNGIDTVSLARQLQPDIVVMDVSMPDMNGVDATRKIAELAPEVRVLALSGHSESGYVKGMLDAGAKGYLIKKAATTELLIAIEYIAQGKIYISPAVNDVLLDSYLNPAGDGDKPAVGTLSVREREVLQRVAEGCSSAQIADRLGLSKRTVETHRKRIMDKLGLRSTAELTKYAIREGLTSLDS